MTQLDIMAEIIAALCADTVLFSPIRTDTLPDGNGIFISLCSETKTTEFLNGAVIRRNELDFYIKHVDLYTALTAAEEVGRLFTRGICCAGIISSGISETPERVSSESGMYMYKIRTWYEFSEGGE